MQVVTPPRVKEIFGMTTRERLAELFMRDSAGFVRGEYLHWDKLRHKTPPDDLTLEEWWLLVKQARQPLLRPIPLVDSAGMAFSTRGVVEPQRLRGGLRPRFVPGHGNQL